jgi:hypothetical protein
MKLIIGGALLGALFCFTAPTVTIADQPISCTCGDKKFSGSCPDGQTPRCDCGDHTVKCNAPDPTKPSKPKESSKKDERPKA